MERAAAEWRYHELHANRGGYHDGTFERWSDKRSADFPYAANDGVTIWVSEVDLNPHDHFLGGKNDCAECSGRDAVEREEDDGSGQQS